MIEKQNPDHQPKHAGRLTPAQFRSAVWRRDGGRDRATGKVLSKEHVDPAHRGQVCHFRGRRVMPEWATDPDRALLMSDSSHILSDARGGNLLKLTDPVTGEPADDGTKKIRFTLYDRAGNVVWTRTS
jgi:hypothetical protein